VCITGHIDHGKTTLLDALQHSNLVATEPGLITQSIRAFTIHTPTDPDAATDECATARRGNEAADSATAEGDSSIPDVGAVPTRRLRLKKSKRAEARRRADAAADLARWLDALRRRPRGPAARAPR
jgi:hypothetical protein